MSLLENDDHLIHLAVRVFFPPTSSNPANSLSILPHSGEVMFPPQSEQHFLQCSITIWRLISSKSLLLPSVSCTGTACSSITENTALQLIYSLGACHRVKLEIRASYIKGEKTGGKLKLNAKILQNRKRKLTGVPGRPDFPDGPGSPGLPWDAS